MELDVISKGEKSIAARLARVGFDEKTSEKYQDLILTAGGATRVAHVTHLNRADLADIGVTVAHRGVMVEHFCEWEKEHNRGKLLW